MKKGIFVTIEGPDGAGKSTQLNYIQKFFQKTNREVIFTREPGGTPIGEEIRKVILDTKNKEMDSKAETLLYLAARAQHVSQLILPALKKGKIVVSDRYMDSTTVYQGFARGLGKDVEEINNWVINEAVPDLTIVLAVNPEIGKARRENRKEDRIESESFEFHQKVYEGYLKLANKYPERILFLDGTDTVENIKEKIENSLERLMKEK